MSIPRVWSHRFLEVNGTSGWTVTYVPAGYVAVIKFAALINATATAGVAAMIIHNAYIFRGSVPGNGSAQVGGLHAVAFENEQLGINFPATGWQGHISGFLLQQPPTGVGIFMAREEMGEVTFEQLEKHALGPGSDPYS